MQKRTTQFWGAAGAIFLALIIAAFLASIARSSRSLGASLAEAPSSVRSGEITVVVVAQHPLADQPTISPERRVRNRRNIVRALATSAIPVIPSLSEADEQLLVSDAETTDPEIAFDLAQGIGGPLPSSASANAVAAAPAPVTLVPIAIATRPGNVTIVPTLAVAPPPAAPAAPAQPSNPTATPARAAPTATASIIAPKPEASKTPIPPTASPAPIATSVGPTKPPATSAPTVVATSVPTTVRPTIAVTGVPTASPHPTTAVPATTAPPTSAPATVRPTAIPPTPLPPTDVPTVVVPPTVAPPTLVPPTSVPPTATTPPPTITPSPEPSATLEPITYLHTRVYSADDHSAQVGWQITVYRQGSDDMLAAAATGENGDAHVTLQPAGARVCVDVPSGWRVVYPVDGCYYQSLPSGDLTLEFVVAPQR